MPTVFVARDTRKGGKRLCDHARDAALALKANVLDFGELTTPQLHYSVRTFNLGGGALCSLLFAGLSFLVENLFPSLDGGSPISIPGFSF